ncbi:TPA: VCBS domain-containing protein, partial [Klebsiella oxytoca]|nr:VCBS domain-containing protein [Klebsiella oxytoca]
MNLLGVVDVSLLSGNNFDFTVASGTTQDVALDISGGTTLSSAALINTLLLLLGGTDTFKADLAVINTVTGEVVALASNAVTITAGGVSLDYSGSASFSDLPEGNYTVVISSPTNTGLLPTLVNFLANISVATAVDVAVTDSVGYESAIISGNVLQTDAGGDVGDIGTGITVTSIVAFSVSGASAQQVSSGGTIVEGAYGKLVIYADGTYTYQATGDADSVGQTEVFTYTITDADGDTATTTLTINIGLADDTDSDADSDSDSDS